MDTRRLRRVILPLAAVALIVVRSTLANAAAGSVADADDVSGFDIKSMTFTDGSEACPEAVVECITLGFEAHSTFTPAQAGSAQLIWDLDLNGAPATSVGSDEACLRLKFVGGTFQAELYKDCGPESFNQYTATQPAGDKAQVKISKSDLIAMGLSSTATKYSLRLTAQASGDVVPESSSGFAQHCFGSSGCPGATSSPTPTATGSSSPTPTGSSSPTPSGSAAPSPTPTLGPNDTSATGTPPKSTVAPGEAIQLTGTGFKPSATLTMTMFSTPASLGTTTANASGAFTANVTIPAAATVGSHSIVIEGANTRTPTAGIHRLTYPITVAVASAGSDNNSNTLGSTQGLPAASSSGGTLPKTGASIAVLVVVAAMLIMAGLSIMDWASSHKERHPCALPPLTLQPAPERLRWGAVGDPSSYA